MFHFAEQDDKYQQVESIDIFSINIILINSRYFYVLNIMNKKLSNIIAAARTTIQYNFLLTF